MFLQYYVIDSATGKQVNIEIEAASQADLDVTRNGWQTDWTSEFISDPALENTQPKQKPEKSWRWGRIAFGKAVLLYTLPI